MAGHSRRLAQLHETGMRAWFYALGQPDPFLGEIIELAAGVVTLRCYEDDDDDEPWGQVDLLAEDIRVIQQHRDTAKAYLERCTRVHAP